MVDAKTQEMLIGLGKDWLAGGVSAGISKTAVAPIGELFICLIVIFLTRSISQYPYDRLRGLLEFSYKH